MVMPMALLSGLIIPNFFLLHYTYNKYIYETYSLSEM